MLSCERPRGLIPITFRHPDAEDLTIIATSENSSEFAHVSLTKDGLGLREENHETRKYRCLPQAMVRSN